MTREEGTISRKKQGEEREAIKFELKEKRSVTSQKEGKRVRPRSKERGRIRNLDSDIPERRDDWKVLRI